MQQKIHFIVMMVLSVITGQQALAQSTQSIDRELAIKDSLLFNIFFNSCRVDALPGLLTEDFTFFHDRGLNQPTTTQNHQEFTESIKRLCAGKGKPAMRREIVKGTLQAFLLNPASAVQTGVQRFYQLQNGTEKTLVEESKFTRQWRKEKGTWKLASETDYLVNSNPGAAGQRFIPQAYVPASKELHQTVAGLDSLYFATYNYCELAKMDSLTAEDIEFYHDRGGLTTSKQQLMESIRNNICGKVTRTLVSNSIEVYEIPGFGAAEFGYHTFRNIKEPGESRPGKFVILWKKQGNGSWQLSRVISLH